MKTSSIKMCAMLLPLTLGACGSGGEKESKIIEKPEIKVENGMLTPEVLEAFGRISEAVVSPDGKTIAFTLTYESIEENKGNSEIYLIPATGGDMKRLTKTASSESNLQWIENGERIAFLRHDEETDNSQIFSIKPDGSGEKRHSRVKTGVESFKISPDGSNIVYASAIEDYNKKDEELFKDLPKTTGRVVDDLMYKHWDEWVTKIPHPFVAEFGAEIEQGKDIMEGEPFECPMRPFGGAESFAWSPDGKQLVYVSRKLAGKDYAFSTDSNLYLYDMASGKTTLLTEGMPGYDTDPVFSPDGTTLAWLSMATPKYESDKKRLMVMNMKSGEKKDLTANWDYWPEQIAWSPNGKSIWFAGYYEGVEPVFKIDVNTCAIDTVAIEQADFGGVSPVNDNEAVVLRHSMRVPNEICMVKKGDVKQLSNVNTDLLGQLKLGEVKKVKVPTTDGKQMTCWEILPPDFDPNKKYPAILYCQGGPQQAVSQFWSYRWNFMIMAAHGYVVIAPNRHGVPGFGEEWNRQISGDYGGQNMQDYYAATDYIKARPYVDADHVGAIGASYGGFSVYWLAGHNDGRYAALVAHAGIFNVEAQYLETEEMWFADFDLGGNYWDKENAIAQRTYANSPHRFVTNWTAPMLITVGELDYRILASQGMMAFNAAKMNGLEAEMLVFPDENHWVLKPQNAILWQRCFFRFLDKYLKK
ncbi:MAG: S9 family peptidase [Candidatus Amulumruptor caecigallinarius]|nr:S9 family peptidase [Candidatus Amulumruptor caecigallinarius]